MKKILGFVTILFIVWLLLPISQVNAKPENKHDQLTLPAHDEETEVVYLGKSHDPDSQKVVEGYAFIYRARDSKPAKSPRIPNCYGYLASGAKWKTVENWLVNTDNTRGLDSSFVLDNLSNNMTKWEDASDGITGNSLGVNILGSGSETADTLVADTTAPDGTNEVYFGDIAESGVIAVNTIWGIFSGPTKFREIVEWDLVFDQVDFDWSATGESTKMDFENIATHELGHSTGMNDLYNSSCNLETMFGYASDGETIKRDLHTGDINGINLLY